MRWYEYRMQVDELHAPDELKARLLAMQPEPQAEPKRKKAALRFPFKQVLGLAACAAVCVVGFNALHIGWAGSSGSASSTAMYSMAKIGQAENSIESYSLDTASLDDVSSGSGSATLTSGEAEAAAGSAEQQAKIIYTASLTLESKDYDTARAELEQALSAAGGYLEASDEYSYTDSARSLSLTLRVPEENYQSFLAAIAEIGNVTYKSEQAEDVTTQYMDVNARLENLTAQRDRLKELQAQAESLADLLEIESSLTDVQSQIESWQSQLDWYDEQVSCCTVYLSLEEVQAYTPDAQNFAERLAGAFADGWANFVAGLQQLAVALAAAWPVVVIIAAAAAIVIAVRRKKRK